MILKSGYIRYVSLLDLKHYISPVAVTDDLVWPLPTTEVEPKTSLDYECEVCGAPYSTQVQAEQCGKQDLDYGNKFI